MMNRDDQINSALRDFAARFVGRSAEEQKYFLVLAEKELGKELGDSAKAIALRLVQKLYCRAAARREDKGVCRGA